MNASSYWDGTAIAPCHRKADIRTLQIATARSNYAGIFAAAISVSYERIVRPRPHAIYEYLRDTKKNEPTWLAEKIKVGNPAARDRRSRTQNQQKSPQALELFASVYGAEAGNLAPNRVSRWTESTSPAALLPKL